MVSSTELTPDEQKKSALDAVLGSSTFARSEQLRAFLKLVCEMEMAGRGPELSEYMIGVKALGRPESYSPLEDSSVRTRAYELRQRLQKYYSSEDPHGAVRIELPKGSYVPRFVIGSQALSEQGAIVETPSPAPVAVQARPWRSLAVAFAIGAVLAAAVSYIVMRRSALPRPDPVLKTAWAPVTVKGDEVLICMSTPLSLLVSPYMATVPEGTLKFPAPQELYPLFRRYRPMPRDANLAMQPIQKSVSMGSVQALAMVTSTLQHLGSTYRILPETNSPLPAMRRRSVVLLGSPWYSRAAATLMERTPFTLALDEKAAEIGIIGRDSQSGKKFLPKRTARGEYEQVFGLITVLPGDDPSDAGRYIVVLSGLTSAGTHGAAAFFTSAANLRALQDRFRKEGIQGWPRSYQVVVRCRASEDTQLIGYEYESHVVIAR